MLSATFRLRAGVFDTSRRAGWRDASASGRRTGSSGTQRYLPSTNILETTFRHSTGSFRVIDFAPRFLQFGRAFRPTQLIRIVEPIEGTPRIVVVCEPRLRLVERDSLPGCKARTMYRFEGFASQLRLTTDIPLSYLAGKPFTLTGRQHLVLTWGAPVEEPLAPLCERFWNETARYWQHWVKQCDIPPLFQQEVIRSALTLKLHCFEDTGAIIAAMTTSIPESPGSGRTWDYRYCWLRDSYYVLSAFGLLGQFEEREQFVQYLLNVAGGAPGLNLAPLYRVDGSSNLEESILENWPGYNGEQPVRIGNGAALHSQHDIYGEMVLALTPIFLDERMSAERSPAALRLIEGLARKAISLAGVPDAGIWEYRTEWKPQTFSSLMCWAAADRMAGIADLHQPALRGRISPRRRIGFGPKSSRAVLDANARRVSWATMAAKIWTRRCCKWSGCDFFRRAIRGWAARSTRFTRTWRGAAGCSAIA